MNKIINDTVLKYIDKTTQCNGFLINNKYYLKNREWIMNNPFDINVLKFVNYYNTWFDNFIASQKWFKNLVQNGSEDDINNLFDFINKTQYRSTKVNFLIRVKQQLDLYKLNNIKLSKAIEQWYNYYDNDAMYFYANILLEFQKGQ